MIAVAFLKSLRVISSAPTFVHHYFFDDFFLLCFCFRCLLVFLSRDRRIIVLPFSSFSFFFFHLFVCFGKMIRDEFFFDYNFFSSSVFNL